MGLTAGGRKVKRLLRDQSHLTRGIDIQSENHQHSSKALEELPFLLHSIVKGVCGWFSVKEDPAL